MDILTIALCSFLGIIGGYIGIRLIVKGVFRSYYEEKNKNIKEK